MKYTLLENAIISLDIAVNNFKIFYYNNDEISESEYYEKIKISIVFLENAIELLLKAILVKEEEKCIYTKVNKDIFNKAQNEAKDKGKKLEDILISNLNIRTITYGNTLDIYIDKYCKSKKVKKILKQLGKYRNAITHFGLEASKEDQELICCFIETFDVIYNYLYPHLVLLDESARYYFVDDNFVVETPHGYKFYLDEKLQYNDFLDFVDELLTETSQKYIMRLCYNVPQKGIERFISVCDELLSDQNYMSFFNDKKLKVDNYEETPWYYFSCSELDLLITPYYSSVHNTTIYINEIGNILFAIIHDSNTLYKYVREKEYPCLDEAENDEQWLDDEKSNICFHVELTKQSIFNIIKKHLDSCVEEINLI
ncbi:hypothetical protein [Lachnoclostridium sp.]|uniref:hypothetical protein n=1 Tax=Lachnoclostridium sp. TaxID=2028282 RepID=UPI0028A2A59C|nr:hypothetical protein [Lachnoclostridium sp.]